MVFRRLTLALVSLGLLGSPLATLYCAGDDPASMACCRKDPESCNRAGKSDDCCRTVPNDGSDSATLVKPAYAGVPMQAVALIPATVSTVLDSTIPTARRLLVAESHFPLDLPPPLLSTLRI